MRKAAIANFALGFFFANKSLFHKHVIITNFSDSFYHFAIKVGLNNS